MSVMCHWRYGFIQGGIEFHIVKVSPCTVGEAAALCKVGEGITSEFCGVWDHLLHHQDHHIPLLVRLVFLLLIWSWELFYILAEGDVLYH